MSNMIFPGGASVSFTLLGGTFGWGDLSMFLMWGDLYSLGGPNLVGGAHTPIHTMPKRPSFVFCPGFLIVTDP